MGWSRARAGFTLLEMSIVVGILGVALGGIAMIVRTSGEAFSAGSARMALEGKGNRSLARLTELLRSAERATLAPLLGAPAVQPERVPVPPHEPDLLVGPDASEAAPPGR